MIAADRKEVMLQRRAVETLSCVGLVEGKVLVRVRIRVPTTRGTTHQQGFNGASTGSPQRLEGHKKRRPAGVELWGVVHLALRSPPRGLHAHSGAQREAEIGPAWRPAMNKLVYGRETPIRGVSRDRPMRPKLRSHALERA